MYVFLMFVFYALIGYFGYSIIREMERKKRLSRNRVEKRRRK